ncbi:hypothetical protein [Burkholderia multivorans]|uniref:hypothetical protein n=1 Tax=Burkholderia multivorans TaxID=87883 RepID=UPI001C216840|nr:hypothetical protein [Burkholderia multivorans]MBU9211664.1 hypothetical protein [Burkholderia multivorans]
MKKIHMTLGVDLSAYTTIELAEDTELTQEDLVAIARKAMEDGEHNGKDVIFEPDWGTESALRIVSVTADDEEVLADIPVDASPFDAGQVLVSFLRGHVPLQAVINSAAEFRLIDQPVMEAHRGTLTLPGAEAIEVEFECRKGATREEKDLAFLEALDQIGTVDYVAVGEVRHGV